MAVIFKYPVFHGNNTPIRNGQVVHFGFDGYNQMCAWVNHSDDDMTTMQLYIIGTGFPYSDDDIVVGSLVESSGLVWHLIMKWEDEEEHA